jgi:hypothetical protein
MGEKNYSSRVLLVLLLALSAALFADNKEIDRRVDFLEPSSYYLVFCAREGIVGHAFVAWATEDEIKKQCTQNAFGMYPKEGEKIIGAVPGEIADEALKKDSLTSITDRFYVRLNKTDFDKAFKVMERWKGVEYKLLKSDCVTFVDEVAREIKLNVPNRNMFINAMPQDYIKALIKKNTQTSKVDKS